MTAQQLLDLLTFDNFVSFLGYVTLGISLPFTVFIFVTLLRDIAYASKERMKSLDGKECPDCRDE